MTEHLQDARESVQDAAEAARANVREQLLHVAEGLEDLESATAPSDPDTLETVEEKLVGMIDQVDDPGAKERLQEARDEIDLHRQARGLSGEE